MDKTMTQLPKLNIFIVIMKFLWQASGCNNFVKIRTVNSDGTRAKATFYDYKP